MKNIKKTSAKLAKEIKTGVMKSAWQKARQAAKNFGGKSYEYFAICLKNAWSAAKKQLLAMQLIEIGGVRWTEHGFNRIYFNSDKFGFEKNFYDVKENKFVGCHVQEIINDLLKA